MVSRGRTAEVNEFALASVLDLLDRLTRGPSIEPVAYDTAWIASLRDPASPDRPRFPQSLEWLLAKQRDDGAWGTSEPYAHDRLVCTLAGLAAVARFPTHPGAGPAAADAEAYLRRAGPPAPHPAGEPVGFELLVPALIARARDAGAAVPAGLDRFAAIRATKLALIPAAQLYSNQLTSVHSLEFLGAAADSTRLPKARSDNGSIGNSPAATAFYLEQVDDPDAWRYLTTCLANGGGAAAPVLEPCEHFEMLWTLYHLWAGGVPLTEFVAPEIWDALAGWYGDSGVALSRAFAIPDADDTAVAAMLLASAGRAAEAAVLEQFAVDDGYASFPIERHGSASVNAHVLEAIGRTPGYPDRRACADVVLRHLARVRVEGTHWYDKWHLSPYYATSHVLLALRRAPRALRARARRLARPALAWLETMQDANGGWGASHRSTAEETAYAVLGALAWTDDLVDGPRLAAGATRFLAAAGQNGAGPALWIDKCLYRPPQVVAGAVLGAQCALTRFAARPDTGRPPGTTIARVAAPVRSSRS